MKNTPHDNVLSSSSENVNRVAPEQTLATPHFDEESIQHARPAVPLDRIKKPRFWPLALILMCSFALLGGVLGLALARYEKRAQPTSTAAVTAAPEETPQNESREPLSSPVTNSAKQTNDARPGVSERNAAPTSVAGASAPKTGAVEEKAMSVTQADDARATLRDAFDEWIAATNARDLQRQMNFYHGSVNAFYLKRNVPRAAVRAEKSRVFDHANLINVRAAAPGINMSRDGRAATMRFRKKYAIEGGGEDRRGEVIQELRWVRTDDGWKIVSERDLHVIQ